MNFKDIVLANRSYRRFYEEHVISKEELTRMLDEYYAARGWDVKTGAPTREKLSELGLDYVAEQLS